MHTVSERPASCSSTRTPATTHLLSVANMICVQQTGNRADPAAAAGRVHLATMAADGAVSHAEVGADPVRLRGRPYLHSRGTGGGMGN